MGPNIEEFKGRIKQAVGALTGDRKMRAAGKADEASGRAKHVVQDAADAAKSTIDKAKDKLTGG
ncbi:MAG: CsbD family protein [Candidatus Nanopelagicales bacterium]